MDRQKRLAGWSIGKSFDSNVHTPRFDEREMARGEGHRTRGYQPCISMHVSSVAEKKKLPRAVRSRSSETPSYARCKLPEVLILNDNYARTRRLALPPYIKLAQLYLNVLLSRTIRHDRMRLTEGEYLEQGINIWCPTNSL